MKKYVIEIKCKKFFKCRGEHFDQISAGEEGLSLH